MSDEALDRIQKPLGAFGGLGGFRQSLAAWFLSSARDYPWRRTCDPYAILVSEAMLQQTRIATVLGRGYYQRWMHTFPTWESLAAAREEEVLKCWEGLGYYNRARNLWKTAVLVVRDLGGRFPEAPEAILGLPGIGRYTAGAVLSFAFHRRAAVVDGNVSRVLARVFALGEAVNATAGISTLWAWAGALVPDNDPGIHNAALMELGQRVCRPSNPDCPSCPLGVGCIAHQRGETERFPIKKKGPSITSIEERALLAERAGAIFLLPESGQRRQGLWRLPEITEDASADLEELFRFDYPVTRYRVTLRVFAAPPGWSPDSQDADLGGWFAWLDRSGLPPLGAPYRKAIELRTTSPESPYRATAPKIKNSKSGQSE